MERVFLSVLNMNLTASFVIAAIMLARLPLKKAPRVISYALWGVAGFRLVFPFSFESVVSLLPMKANLIPQDIAMQAAPRINSGIAAVDNFVSGTLPAAMPHASVNPLQMWLGVGTAVWIAGIVILLAYSLITIWLLNRRLRGARAIEGNIYESDNLKTPFVLGFFKPRIYLPAELDTEERSYILLHEQTHIRRRDYMIKHLAYFILCVHWFNPFAWLAFILMCADMELSCDERVLRELGANIKKAYSSSLLSLAMKRRILSGSPLAFGEGGVKARIRNVLNFKKPSRVIIIVAVTLVVVLSVGFAVNRVTEALPWTDVPQKSDWPVRDMSFARVTFGSDREFIVYRMGCEPDEEYVLADEIILYYHVPAVLYTPPEGGEPRELLGTEYDVTFYLNGDEATGNEQLYGVYRIDIDGGDQAGFEMTGREQGDGTLAGVLAQYGGPNAVERKGDCYSLCYYRPDDTDKRLWFEVKDGELTGRMGIICLSEGDGESAPDATLAMPSEPPIPQDETLPQPDGGTTVPQAVIDGMNDPNFVIKCAWTYIAQDINRQVQYSGGRATFSDAKITRLDLTDSFSDLRDGAVIEAYALEYRIKPDEPSQVMLAGGMRFDADNWLTEATSMGGPWLVFERYEGDGINLGDEVVYLGAIYPTGEEIGGVPAAVAKLLNMDQTEEESGYTDADTTKGIR